MYAKISQGSVFSGVQSLRPEINVDEKVSVEKERIDFLLRQHRGYNMGFSTSSANNGDSLPSPSAKTASLSNVSRDTLKGDVLNESKNELTICPFLVQSATYGVKSAPSSQYDIPLASRAEARLKLLPPQLKFIVQNYIDRSVTGRDEVANAWLRTFLSVPVTLIEPTSIRREEAEKTLDNEIFGHVSAKTALLDQLMCWQLTGKNRFVTCLEGPPGIGKTRLLKTLGSLFNRPVISIDMDSVSDDGALLGREPSYQGFNIGYLLNALIESDCLNPVILIDEIDKIKKNDSGRRILDLCNQWLDDERPYFNSVYLNMRVDLSNVAFVIATNDLSAFGDYPSLLNRLLPAVYMSGYSTDEQALILSSRVIPELQKNKGIKVSFADDAVVELMQQFWKYNVHDSGVRLLKKWADNVMTQAIARNESIVTKKRVSEALSVYQSRKDREVHENEPV